MNTFIGCLHLSVSYCAFMFAGFFLCMCLCFCTCVCVFFLEFLFLVAGMNPLQLNIAINVVPVFVC